MRNSHYLKRILFVTLAFPLILSYQNCAPFKVSSLSGQSNFSSSNPSEYSSIQSKIFNARCISCHSSQASMGSYDLTTYVGAMTGGRVIAGMPAQSLLIQRLKDGTMPPAGNLLSTVEIASIEKWISDGALAVSPTPTPAPTSTPAPTATPTPTPNQAPIVNAGADRTLALPIATLTVAGDANDVDGLIAALAWRKVSGPSVTMAGTSTQDLVLTNLVVGTYVFELKVTDEKGAVGTDQVQVKINAAPSSMATFSYIQTNILIPRCLTCHGDSRADGGYRINSYDRAMSAVVPFEADYSELNIRVQTNSMPKGGGGYLSTSQKALIEAWINAGALNN